MKTTKFERVTRRLFFVCVAFTLISLVGMSGFDYFYTIKCQSVEQEIVDVKSSIDALTMQIQELGSFERLNEIASAKGYTYQSDATAATYGSHNGVQ